MRRNSYGSPSRPSTALGASQVTRSPVIFLCLLLALAGCAKREIKNTDSKGRNIICFGDSITAGYGANPGEDYPTELRKMVSMPIINAGVDADTSFEGLTRIQQDVLAKEPYLVIVEFCGNDFLKKIAIDKTLSNVREMIKQIQEKKAMVALVDISAGMFLREYRGVFKKLAEETGSIFVPAVLSGIITDPGMKSDFFHPNASGYKLIAERVYKAIRPYVLNIDKQGLLP